MDFAMIFPGQGSHNFDLLKIMSLNHSIIRQTFDEASNHINYDLWNLIKKKKIVQFKKSKYIQAILLTTSVSIYRLWKKKFGKNPSIAAGHSLGEYSALVCAKCINFYDALKIVMIRNKIMKEAMMKKPGSMIAIIGLNQYIIKNICNKFSKNKIVDIACINSDSEIIISGEENNVQLAAMECLKNGAKAIFQLSINVASHCKLMKPASLKLSNLLKTIEFKKPLFPIINNIEAKCEYSTKKIKNALIKQLYQPIFWKQSIQYIVSKKISLILETGTNCILTNLNKKFINIISIPLSHEKNFFMAKKHIKYGI